RTTTIRASVHDVEIALMISITLVIFVVFAFLRNVWATIIPSVAVPLSLIGTFGVMYLCHYSLDNLSLMALTISTGFVVDDAIVVIENIARYIENAFNRLLRTYDVSLRWVLRHQFLILLVTVGTVCLNVYLFVKTPKGFFPQQDTGRFMGLIQGDQDLSFTAMSQKMREFTDIVL